jgi:iron complex transport system substrate-binding protein
LYITDEAALQVADPDVLLTQAICDLWALSARQVAELGVALCKDPQVLSLDPQLLGDVLEEMRRVGRATGTEDLADSITPDCRNASMR